MQFNYRISCTAYPVLGEAYPVAGAAYPGADDVQPVRKSDKIEHCVYLFFEWWL